MGGLRAAGAASRTGAQLPAPWRAAPPPASSAAAKPATRMQRSSGYSASLAVANSRSRSAPWPGRDQGRRAWP
eukprot:9616796-Lingulodinium_polyedra.AAC.1